MELLFENVGLDNILFSPNGRGIKIIFLDLYKGEHLSSVECKEVFIFNFHNLLNNDTDDHAGFAHYIGDVEASIIKQEELEDWFHENDFKFFLGLDDKIRMSHDLIARNGIVWLRLISGEILIDIGCKTLIQDGKVVLSTQK